MKILTKEQWNTIERKFVEWDNATHSNASQRQIMDWFREKYFELASQPKPSDQDIAEWADGIERCGTSYNIGLKRGALAALNGEIPITEKGE